MEQDLSTSAVNDLAPPASETQSAVSWGAVFAGAAVALALSFVLVALAAGFRLKLASPWPIARSDLAGFTPILGSSMIVIQVVSSALGGYLAGRLRTKWTNVHDHEVHFRDTAHGLLAWAVATVMGVVIAATVLAPLARPTTEAMVSSAAVQNDVPALAAGDVANANAPVDAAALRARAERDANIAAQFSFFMGIGLLLGAFTACVAAAIGGLRREEMHGKFWTEHARVARPVGP
jgi:hypothetical protein